MTRVLASALLALTVVLALPRPARAQRAWNDSTSRHVVQRATDRRARQLADWGLADYSAQEQGYRDFPAQVGEGCDRKRQSPRGIFSTVRKVAT